MVFEFTISDGKLFHTGIVLIANEFNLIDLLRRFHKKKKKFNLSTKSQQILFLLSALLYYQSLIQYQKSEHNAQSLVL